MINLLEAKAVHFIGIGGISMSAIAHILIEKGISVSGSDAKNSDIVQGLVAAGAQIAIGHAKENVGPVDAIVYTGAINPENPEFQVAEATNIPLLRRTQALDQILSDYPIAIAISGTHGKTSTTTMVTQILKAAQLDPSYMIGARLPHDNKAYHITGSDFIAVEACEYKASFLDLHPTTIVVNNIEEEHLDYYKSLDAIVDTFSKFADSLSTDNYLVLNLDDPNAKRLTKHPQATIVTYSLHQPADYEARHIVFNPQAHPSFDLYIQGDKAGHVTLSVPGKHNVYNALGAIAAAHINGIEVSIAISALSEFKNAERRYEILGSYHGATLVTDYAHHPSEIKATLNAALNLAHQEVVAVYQPHTYSRTATLLQETAEAFKGAAQVLITDIYAARETNTYGIHATDLVAALTREGIPALYVGGLDALAQAVRPLCHEGATLLMMGAGDIDQAARQLLK